MIAGLLAPCIRGQKTREGAASAVRHRHDHRHRGQTSETQELFDADKRPGEKCGLGAPRVDVGRIDQVGRDAAGEFWGLGQLVEDLGGGMGPVCMGVSPVVGGGVGIARPAARAWNA